MPPVSVAVETTRCQVGSVPDPIERSGLTGLTCRKGDPASVGSRSVSVHPATHGLLFRRRPLPFGPLWTIDATATDPSCRFDINQTIRCDWGDLAPGASRQMHMVAPDAGTARCSTISNTALAESDDAGNVLSATVPITITCP